MNLQLPDSFEEESIRTIKKEIDSFFNKIFRKFTLKNLENKEFLIDFLQKNTVLLRETSNFANQIFKKYKFLNPKKFGYETSIKFWHFIYFADFNIYKDLQKRYLFELEKSLKLFPKLRPYYAFLSDKLNSLENKPQKYSSYVFGEISFTNLEEVSSRRNAMNLPALSYSKSPIYLIIGIPASGKDTQAAILATNLGWPRIDAGSIFTETIRKKEKYWEEIQSSFNQQQPIPSEVFLEIMKNRFSDSNLKKGFVLTQHSKSVDEAEKMIKILDELNYYIKKVFYLNIDKNLAIERAVSRLNGQFTEKEPSLEAIASRINNYYNLITFTTDFYKQKGLLVEIDGTKSVEEVTKEIEKAL